MDKLIKNVMDLLKCSKEDAITAIDTTLSNHLMARKGVLLSVKKEFDTK
jgi:hypothetical protein